MQKTSDRASMLNQRLFTQQEFETNAQNILIAVWHKIFEIQEDCKESRQHIMKAEVLALLEDYRRGLKDKE